MGKAIVTIWGGMGNQLFQYAFAKLVEQKTGLSVYLYDITGHSTIRRQWQLHHFNISLPIMQFNRANKLLGKKMVLRIFRKIFKKLDGSHYFHYVQAYQPLFPELRRFISLDDTHSSEDYRQGTNILAFVNQLDKRHFYWLEGYWQSWITVDTIQTALKQDIRFVGDLHTKTIVLLDQIKAAATPVAVHLRTDWHQKEGGEALKTSYSHNQRSLSITYYQKAITYTRQQCHQPTFFIFADDIRQASELLSELEPNDDIIYIPHEDRPAWQDLFLMKHCRHFVLSNSTFAWWGCWLASHNKRICIMPDNWSGHDTGQLITSQLEMGKDTIRL